MNLLRIMEKHSLIILLLIGLVSSGSYHGARIGKFSTHFHDVRGEVYAVDDKTLFIKGFNYDGKGQDAVFWAGNSIRPDTTGFIIPNHKASFQPLSQYNNQDLILRLPEGKKVNDIHWLSVWSKKHSTSFGTLIFPKSLVPPRPVVIGPLINTKKGVSSGDILVLDTQTFLIPDFSYDGSGKGAVWWVSRGLKPNMGGVRLRQEGGSDAALEAQKNKIAVVTLPDGHSISDYTILSVFSAEDIDDYGLVRIPQDLKVPPSPRTLTTQEELETGKFNCEMLNDNLGLEVRWLITGNEITIRLVGNIDSSEYMALGLSKDDTETRFDASDAVLAWLDSKGHVVDYFLENMEKCENGYGMCPDVFREGAEDNLTLLDAIRSNKTTIITFKRPLSTDDKKYDQNIYTDGPQAILWAVGPVQNNGLAGPPKLQTRGNLLLDFGREPNWNCPPPKEEIFSAVRMHENEFDSSPEKKALESNLDKHNTYSIHCPSDKIFRAQMGVLPSTGLKVWFINGLPTPHLTVQRGMTYTFIVEGGMSPPNHHPLYITNSKEGGIYQNILEAKEGSEQAYAGVQRDPMTGSYLPTAEGRFCEWSVSDRDPESAVVADSDSVTSALTLNCEDGKAGTLAWTPNAETTGNVYYQSFTERNRGGKISIVDFCEETNPHYYLANGPESGKDYPQTGKRMKTNLEREDDASDLTFLLNTKEIVENSREDNIERNDNFRVITGVQNFPEINHENSKEIPQFSSIEDMINYFGTPEKHGSSHDVQSEKPFKSTDEIEESAFTASDSFKSLVPDSEVNSQQPHDESERSDKVFNQRLNLQGTSVSANKIKNQHAPESSRAKRPQNAALTPNRQSHITQPPDFKPQFEGGFVPLVMNSGKEKESVISKDFALPPAHLRRPHRPFLFNESIPFHGTFKPGVPDFSGFNISNYSQEDSSYPLNHLQDNLPLLSMPKPQIIQRPLTIVNGLPPELIHRPKGPFERPQIFRYPPRQQNPGFGGHQQRIFAQLPLRNRPSVRPMLISHSSDEDLSEGSSQRVQVALQLPGNEKNKDLSILQVMRVPGLKHQPEIKTNKIVPPILQRRPDLAEDTISALNSNRLKRPQQGKPFLQRTPNNKLNDPQLMQAAAQSGNLRLPLNIQRPLPVAKQTFNSPGNGFRRLPSVPPRQRHPFLQRPSQERFPNLSNLQKNIVHKQHISNIPELEIVEISDGSKNANNIKALANLDELVDTIETNALLSKEKYELPLFLKPEAEPTQNGQPQLLVLRQQLANPGSVFKSMPQNFPGKIRLNDEEERNIKLVQTSYVNHKPNVFHHSLSTDVQNDPAKDLLNKKAETNPTIPPEVSSQLAVATEMSINKNENAKKVLIEQQSVDLIKNASEVPDQFTDTGVNSNNNKDINEQIEILYDEGDNEEIKTEIHPSEFGKPNLNFVNSKLKGTNIETEEKETLKPEIEVGNIELDDTEDFEEDESTDSDYIDYNVPFGARLKSTLSGAKFHTKPSFEIPKKPDLFRKPHLPPPLAKNTNSNAEKSPFSTTITNIPKAVINRAPEDIALKPSLPSNIELHSEINPANASPPLDLSNSSRKNTVFNSSLYFNYESPSRGPSNVPFTLSEDFISKYPGRKNILPSVDSPGQPRFPTKVPDNINLPHISEKPPTHDNGTDYSILNHILTLIGGSPNHNVATSQNSYLSSP